MTNSDHHLGAVLDEAKSWLLTQSIPIWLEYGLDRKRGGFYESLSKKDLSCKINYKRLRLLARQIYSFSAAYSLGHRDSLFAVEHGLNFLFEKAFIKSGNYPRCLDMDGHIIDGTHDLYDMSFCLFALSHAYKIIKDRRIYQEAIKLTEFLNKKFRHPTGGFIESLPMSNPRLQNPHMHLFEALLEWRINTDELIFIELSDELASLFFNKFYNKDTGALLEYYDEMLHPLSDHSQRLTEPGHHFEWFWLLDRYERLTCKSIPSTKLLYEFAISHGYDRKSGLLFSGVFDNGSPKIDVVRLWPHTEWMKAEIAISEHNKPDKVFQAWAAVKQFLNCQRGGLWHERYDYEKKMFVQEPSPASSLYHIVLAITSLNEKLNEHL